MSVPETIGRLSLVGELSIFTAAERKQCLLEIFDVYQEVEVDLSQVGEIDSAGIQVMIAAKREATERGKPLRFVGHSESVFDILELCDLAGQLGDPVLIHSRT